MKTARLILVLSGLAFLTVAPARDWFVNPDAGKDGADGSAAAPLASAQQAVDRAGVDDRIILLPAGGTYSQSIDLSGAPNGLVLDGNGVTLDGGGTRDVGLSAEGDNRNVKVFNLSANHHRLSGFSIGGNSRGFQFFGIAASGNGKQGFVAGDKASCWINDGKFESEAGADSFASRDAAETYHVNGSFHGPISLEGGRHSLTHCTLVENPGFGLITIRGGGGNADAKGGTASLVIQALSFTPNSGVQAHIEIGPGSFVYHDAESKETLSKFEISRHPSSELNESLYHTFPIGRDNSGTPIMAWAGGGTRQLPTRAYRLIHFGKHVPQDIAAKLSPENDWLGLLAPLDTAEFPPQGKAFEPAHASAHAIWRWIGLTAPDAVFVPDTPEGLALGKALQIHPPAGVGMVPVFVTRAGADGTLESIVLPVDDAMHAMAKSEMLARVARSPEEMLQQLSSHYGDSFDGSYLDALAIIARKNAGLNQRAAELAKARLDANSALPKNSGELAGTLLFAELDEPWAKDRLRAVADMAFDAEGAPLAAMPLHNEMSDAVFMASPLLARAAGVSGDRKYHDAAYRNFQFIAKLCLRPDGIYRHSPLNDAAWGRGNGFPALGLALTLTHFPKDHEGFAAMLDSLRAHLEALAPHQDADGMWHQIIDHPDSYAEVTSTAMIAYAIAVAIEQGWIEEGMWRSRLDAAWSALKMRVSTDGKNLINVCTGTGKQKTLEDYYLREAVLGPDKRGAAMVMMLAAQLGK